MSLEGASHKSATPVLRLASSKDTEHTARRVSNDEARLGRGARPSEVADATDALNPEVRRYPRYVPAANVFQMLLDIVLMAGSQSVILFLIFDRLGLQSPTHAAFIVGCSVLLVLIFLYATGCYRRDAILSASLSLSRLPVALGCAAVALFVALHYGFSALFPASRVYLSISRDVTIVLIGVSISLGALLVSRLTVRSMLTHNMFRRRILVIGTGKRARYIQELNESHAHGALQDIHFASEAILKDPATTTTSHDDRAAQRPAFDFGH